MKFRTAHDNHKRYKKEIEGKSMTHQSHAPETDINNVMRRYEKTGVIEHRNNFEGRYADFTNTPTDYHESMNAVIAADEMFGGLPAKVRKRFHNDAGAFLDFVGNPDNADELVALGLATPVSEAELSPAATPTPRGDERPRKRSKNRPEGEEGARQKADESPDD